LANFLPTSDGAQSATISVNGTQTVTLTGTGEQPLVGLVLSNTPSTGSGVAGSPVTVTATLTQPNIAGDTPSGAVTFSYTVDSGTPVAITPVPMAAGSGGTSTASFTLPGSAVLQGRLYLVSATYQGDTQDSPTVATPLQIYVPGVPVTATAASVSYTYGQAVPALTGTVTGITDSSVTYKFISAATPSSPVTSATNPAYPIEVVFAGGTYLNYGFPPFPHVTTSGGAPATVTENPAPLTVTANNATAPYGAPNLSFTSSEVGAQNGDKFAATYTLPSGVALQSQNQPVGTYLIVPVLASKAIASGDYTQTVVDGTLTITAAPTSVSMAAAAVSVLPTALTSDPIIITVASAVSGASLTELPTGTVTITDIFTPIIPSAPGTSATVAPVAIGPFTLSATGTYTYTPTSQTLGTHSYTVAYSGDHNFQPILAACIPPQVSTTAVPCSTQTPTNVIVDVADFVVSSTTTPVQIAPGIIPGGLTTVAGESAATPETATVTVASILSYKGTVYLGCTPQNPTYVTCTLAPPSVTVPSPASGTTTASVVSIISIQTPATLPLGFKFGTTSQLRRPVSETMLAFLPLGILAFCLRRRRRLSNALWMLLAISILTTGLNGCGDNSVDYFTPVPSGPQYVTIYTCSVQSDCTNPISGTPSGAGVIRAFKLPINIQ